MVNWQSLIYRLLIFSLFSYALILLHSLYKQGDLPLDKQQLQEYGQKVQNKFQSYLRSEEQPLMGLYNVGELHSYAYFYRNYTKLLNGKRSTAGVLAPYEKDELLQWTSWFQGTIFSARAKWNGRGLVILTSTFDIRRTVLQLKTLRFLKCPLDIKVYYTQESAPIKEELEMLKQETGYEAEELSIMLSPRVRDLVTIRLAKPFAAFYSPFSQVIVADTDTVFVGDPSKLFEDLKEGVGAVFSLDRELFPGNYELAKYVLEILPQPYSDAVADGKFIQQKSSYQQDSTVIVLDKNVAWLGLIATGNLVLPPLDKLFRPKFEGEKEAFWIGFEQAKVPFEWEKRSPVSVGHIAALEGGKTNVCGGHVGHFSSKGELVWISGAYDRNSGRDSSPQPDFFKNMVDPKWAGKWSPNLCQAGEAADFSGDVKKVLEFMEANYSPDYMIKYYEKP